jgi:hypothetical protein
MVQLQRFAVIHSRRIEFLIQIPDQLTRTRHNPRELTVPGGN